MIDTIDTLISLDKHRSNLSTTIANEMHTGTETRIGNKSLIVRFEWDWEEYNGFTMAVFL